MYVKRYGQLKSIKQYEMMSNQATILIHIEDETGLEEVYKCPSVSPNHYHLRNLVASHIYFLSDIGCGNRNFSI